EFNNIQGEVNNLHRDRRSTVALEGNLILPEQKQPTQLRLQGNASLNIDDEIKGLTPTFNLDLACKSLDLDAIGASFINLQEGTSLSGKTDVDIIFKSSQQGYTNFQAKLNSENLGITPNSLY
ncbi:MAG: hypothetical protein GWO08_00555, partial [Gammaproteobacteria bacterium]|nr:hypothetical protein [Gammaproteobacteria bacterium]NIR92199.1 hypothetical protein [Gammaproteobacteria bacterium]NIW43415.1 hypothetical protein [Gammaproteobacteria bacterium]NIW97453.1 hypothetical protein [Phycisphaerae bacterium]